MADKAYITIPPKAEAQRLAFYLLVGDPSLLRPLAVTVQKLTLGNSPEGCLKYTEPIRLILGMSAVAGMLRCCPKIHVLGSLMSSAIQRRIPS